MTEDYRLFAETPSAEDYLRLRVMAGLTPKTAEGAAAGLPNTVFSIVVRKGDEVVGMGRVIGDGGFSSKSSISPSCPNTRARGWEWRSWVCSSTNCALRLRREPCQPDGEAHRLYAQFGFALTAPRSVGMAFVV